MCVYISLSLYIYIYTHTHISRIRIHGTRLGPEVDIHTGRAGDRFTTTVN